MQYYHPDFFQELGLGLGLDWCKFAQNGKTLGQFFELLYVYMTNRGRYVLMGSHGHSPLTEIYLGSNCER
jgi:hypothetical protein